MAAEGLITYYEDPELLSALDAFRASVDEIAERYDQLDNSGRGDYDGYASGDHALQGSVSCSVIASPKPNRQDGLIDFTAKREHRSPFYAGSERYGVGIEDKFSLLIRAQPPLDAAPTRLALFAQATHTYKILGSTETEVPISQSLRIASWDQLSSRLGVLLLQLEDATKLLK